MDDKALLALNMMARRVSESQDCVLELLIGEEGMLAHLITLDAYESEMEDDEDD